MASNFLLDVADRSEKWYIRPGETKSFDLIARNNSDQLVRCLLTVLEPRSGIHIEPTAFTLAAAQHVRAKLKLNAPATMGDDLRVVLQLSSKSGALLASFERRVANAQPDAERASEGAAALFSIEPADRAGRWYVTPGSAARYELRVRNAGSSAGTVSLTLDQPADLGSIEPAELSVGPREVKTVTLIFDRDAKVLIGQRAVVTARAPSGKPLATFERELYAASDTDCTVDVSLARVVVREGEPTGIVLACSTKSLSQGSGVFPLDHNAHPTLTWPQLAPLALQPGETRDFEISVAWDPARAGPSGTSHPPALEVGVGVSYGRRSAKVMWEVVRAAIDALSPKPEPAPEPAVTAVVDAPPEIVSAAAAAAPEVSPAPPVEPEAQPERHDFLTAYGAPPARMLTPARAPRAGMRPPVIGLIFLGVALLVVSAYLWLQPTFNARREAAPAHPASLPSGVLQTLPPKASAHGKVVAARPATPKPPPAVAKSSAPTPEPTPRATPRPRRTSVALIAPKPRAPQPRPPKPTARPSRQRINRNAVVALGGLDAQFVLAGHAVRVAWAASSQSSADVQLINDRGKIVSERRVGPFKRNVLIYLPRSYRGGVLVQLVGFGYHGERVSETASLTPYGQ